MKTLKYIKKSRSEECCINDVYSDAIHLSPNTLRMRCSTEANVG